MQDIIEESGPVKITDLERLRRLHIVIQHHNNLYFVKNAPEIPDNEYDRLFASYKTLTEQYPEEAKVLAGNNNVLLPLTEVSGLQTITFRTPMMSLDKAFNRAEFTKFVDKLPKDTQLDYEYKLDGLALEATYLYGVLKAFKTRYDGTNGEDVLHNVPLFDNTLPLYVAALEDIPEVNVRGEAYLTLETFNQLNEIGNKQYKTPRSAASGLTRRLAENAEPLANGLLRFNTYYCDNDFGLTYYTDLKQHLTTLGFTTPPEASLNALVLNERPLDIPTDGIVIKVNEIALQRELGERQQNPRWAVAYKFPPEMGTTELLGVHWSLSMSGNLTPIAIYSPVVIGGVTNTNATLFNYRTFKQKGLKLGAKLEIVRSGDCIPHINRVVENGKGKLINAPKECPACGELLLYSGVSTDDVNLYCPNSLTCKGQLAGRIDQLLGRTGLNVKGIGLAAITEWVSKGIVARLTDLYTVSASLLGERFHTLLHANKAATLSQFLVGLALPGVGVVTAKNIAIASIRDNVPVMDLLSSNDKLQAAGVDIGTALIVADYFSETEKYREVEKLMGYLEIVPEAEVVLTGQRVYLSGNSDVPRKTIKAMLANRNIELAENFSGQFDAILLGTRYSENKVTTATKRGVSVITLPTPFNLDTVVTAIEATSNVVK